MEYAIIAAILGAIGLIGNYFSNRESSRLQRQHDMNMAEINKQNQKELMDYEVSLQQQNNTIATQTGHAAQAGVNPALLYGGMSAPALSSVSGGSNTGSSSSLPELRLFDRLPTSNVVESLATQRKQQMDYEKNLVEMQEMRQRTMESASRTAENIRNTSYQKSIEKIIFDQQVASLHLLEAQGENLNFQTERGRIFLPLELEEKGLINSETAAKIDKINSDIQKNNWEMRQIRKDIERMDSVIDLNDAERSSVIESVKKSAIGRIMQEFGLSSRLLPAQLRSASELHKALNNEQMKGAYIALRNMGFSEHEATNAVIYYSVRDPKDATPSVLNSASRIFSALVLKK